MAEKKEAGIKKKSENWTNKLCTPPLKSAAPTTTWPSELDGFDLRLLFREVITVRAVGDTHVTPEGNDNNNDNGYRVEVGDVVVVGLADTVDLTCVTVMYVLVNLIIFFACFG